MEAYGGFSTGGSNNLSFSNSKFKQDVYGPQGNALQNLWTNAQNQYDRLTPGMEAQLPNAAASANQTFLNALVQSDRLNAGGAYQGISGADIANQISGSNQRLLNAQGPGYQSLLSGPRERDLPAYVGMQNLPEYTVGQNLPGAINTNQSNLVNRMRLSGGTNNPLLGQAGLIQQDTNPNQTSNQQRIYESIMGGSGNSYADALKNQMQTDALRTAGTSLNALDARAARAGMSGSSRQGIAQSGALQGINQNLQRGLTEIGYNTFDKDLAQKLDIARQADQANVQRYLGNQQYNLGLVGAGNTAAQNAQTYNLGMGGLGNAQNQQNLTYNLGLGQNVNTANQNAQNYNLGYGQNINTANQNAQNYNLGYGSNVNTANQNSQNYNLGMNQALMNYNLGQQQANQNYNLGLDQNNIARQNLLTGMVGGQQGSMNAGMQMLPTIQGMAGGGMNQYLAPGQLSSQLADTIGGPIILGSGKSNSISQGSSNAFGMGGGGGTVICTELHRQGLMSDEIYDYDALFGEMIRMTTPETYDGYISWAPTVVEKMRKSKFLTKAINVFAKPWSKEMARRMGSNHKFSLVGFVIMELGLAICSTIGNIKKEMEVA